MTHPYPVNDRPDKHTTKFLNKGVDADRHNYRFIEAEESNNKSEIAIGY